MRISVFVGKDFRNLLFVFVEPITDVLNDVHVKVNEVYLVVAVAGTASEGHVPLFVHLELVKLVIVLQGGIVLNDDGSVAVVHLGGEDGLDVVLGDESINLGNQLETEVVGSAHSLIGLRCRGQQGSLPT